MESSAFFGASAVRVVCTPLKRGPKKSVKLSALALLLKHKQSAKRIAEDDFIIVADQSPVVARVERQTGYRFLRKNSTGIVWTERFTQQDSHRHDGRFSYSDILR